MKRDENLLTIGMGFGDESKGSFVHYISNNYDIKYYVKYNGGCQGRHCIVADGKEYVFSQLSPSILNGCTTILTNNFVFEPFSLMNEINCISETSGINKSELLKHIIIDNDCICVTAIHKIYNRLEESSKKGEARGSVGTGVSIAGHYTAPKYKYITLKASDLGNKDIIKKILTNQLSFFINLCDTHDYNDEQLKDFDINQYIEDIYEVAINIRDCMADTKSLIESHDAIYESSQGILLDKKYGFYPNTTLLDTSCDSQADIANKIGFIRCLYTRHGNGIFPTEDAELEEIFDDPSQQVSQYNGKIRFGYFDCVLLKYASLVTGIRTIYMSHIDYLRKLTNPKICVAYKYNGEISEKFKELFRYEVNSQNEILIRVIKKPDKTLTDYLKDVTPMYKEVKFDDDFSFNEKMETYISLIEEECNVSVPIISFGANIGDKFRRKEVGR